MRNKNKISLVAKIMFQNNESLRVTMSKIYDEDIHVMFDEMDDT